MDQKVVRNKIVFGVLLAAVGGLMLGLGMEFYGAAWFLAPFAVVPMVVAQYRFFPRKWSGLAMGVMWFVYFQMAYYVAIRQLVPWWVGVVLAIVMALVGTFLGSFDRIFNERTGFRFYLLTMPAVWVGWDFLISGNLIHSTEGQIQYMLGKAPILIQPISLLGAPALAYVMLMFGCAIGLAIVRWMDSRTPPVDSPALSAAAFKKIFITAMALTLVWALVSVGLFYRTQASLGSTVRIAAIEVGTGAGFDAAGMGEFNPKVKEVLERLSRQAAADGAKLLVWPELGLNFDPRVTNKEWLPGLAQETKTYLQAAWFFTDPAGDQHNAVGLWAPDGQLLGAYNKINPVPVAGEWFSQPISYPVFDTAIGRIGMLICFDASFYYPSRNLATNGAQILASSNGNWKDAAVNRMATAQFRAVENNVGFVKEELITGAAMIDPTGTVVAATTIPAGEDIPSAYLIGDLALGQGTTVYDFIGDFFGQLCVLGLFLRIYFQILVHRTAMASRKKGDRSIY